MTRTMIAFVSAVAIVLASATTVLAQGKRGSAPKPQHVSAKGTTTKISSQRTAKAPKTTGPRTTAGSPSSKGPKTTTVKATGKTKTASSPATKAARADAARTTVDTTTPVTLTRVQERLQQNTKLADRLEGRLPRGTDLMDAAEGFRNLGQFVAAVNVSNNLGLDFDKLKVAMVDDGRSLGQAIQFVKTDVDNPTVVAQRAESEAQALIQQTERTTTTTTSRPPQKTKSNDKSKRNGSGS